MSTQNPNNQPLKPTIAQANFVQQLMEFCDKNGLQAGLSVRDVVMALGVNAKLLATMTMHAHNPLNPHDPMSQQPVNPGGTGQVH
jgi:hypothetical protein